MVPRSLALTALLLSAAPALAQGRSEPLMDLLGRLPTPVLEGAPGSLADIHAADLAATAALQAGLPPNPQADRFGPFARLQLPLFIETLPAGLEGDWAVGFDPGDIEAALILRGDLGDATLLRLAAGTAAGVPPALLALGYEDAAQGGIAAFARGEDGSQDLSRAGDGSDPFAAGRGRAARVALDGDHLVHADSWAGLGALRGSAQQGHPDLAPMAAALDRPEWDGFALLQAVVWTDPSMLAPAGEGRLPPWRTALLADLQQGLDTLTLVVLAYPDRVGAEAAAATLAADWTSLDVGRGDTMAEAIGAAAEVQVLGDGPFLAVAALRAPLGLLQGDYPANQPFARLLLMRGQFGLPVLGAGQG